MPNTPVISTKVIKRVLANQDKVDRAVAHHVKRPFTPVERKKIYIARCAAEHISLNSVAGARVVISIYNQRNPNGISVTYWPAAKVHRAERFINRSWMEGQVARERAAGTR